MGCLLSFMVGPVFFVLLETAVTRGFRAAIVFDLGVVVADIVFILIAFFSSYQILDRLKNEPGLFIFGGAVLFIYGLVIMLRTDIKSVSPILERGTTNYLGLFFKGFLLNFINVGVLFFWVGILLVVGPGLGGNGKYVLSFFAVLVSSYVLIDVLKILLAKQLRNKLTPVRILYIKRFLGLILLLSGIFLITKGILTSDWIKV